MSECITLSPVIKSSTFTPLDFAAAGAAYRFNFDRVPAAKEILIWDDLGNSLPDLKRGRFIDGPEAFCDANFDTALWAVESSDVIVVEAGKFDPVSAKEFEIVAASCRRALVICTDPRRIDRWSRAIWPCARFGVPVFIANMPCTDFRRRLDQAQLPAAFLQHFLAAGGSAVPQ